MLLSDGTPSTPFLPVEREPSQQAHLLMSPNPREDALDNIQPSDNELHSMLPSQFLFDETGASAAVAAAAGTSSSAAEDLFGGGGTIDDFYLPISMCIRSVGIGATAGNMQHEQEQEQHEGRCDDRVQLGVNGVGDTVHFIEGVAAGGHTVNNLSDDMSAATMPLSVPLQHGAHMDVLMNAQGGQDNGNNVRMDGATGVAVGALGDAKAGAFGKTATGAGFFEMSPTSVMTGAMMPDMVASPPAPRKRKMAASGTKRAPGRRGPKRGPKALKKASSATAARTEAVASKPLVLRRTPGDEAAALVDAYAPLVGRVDLGDARVASEYEATLQVARNEAEARKKAERMRLRNEPQGPGAPNQCASRMEAKLSRFHKDAYIVALQHELLRVVREACVYRRVAMKFAPDVGSGATGAGQGVARREGRAGDAAERKR